ncbi:hypothetical protein [Parafrankia sp. BMG5.11]|uniref:hypothetical protein n=1 Tax=Parafrankia sp. BMG5.11 TaxID=222540 RepID=UPI001A9E5BB9|nr:hypothetical protein [Parafrankia sp. BMG5.11]
MDDLDVAVGDRCAGAQTECAAGVAAERARLGVGPGGDVWTVASISAARRALSEL